MAQYLRRREVLASDLAGFDDEPYALGVPRPNPALGARKYPALTALVFAAMLLSAVVGMVLGTLYKQLVALDTVTLFVMAASTLMLHCIMLADITTVSLRSRPRGSSYAVLPMSLGALYSLLAAGSRMPVLVWVLLALAVSMLAVGLLFMVLPSTVDGQLRSFATLGVAVTVPILLLLVFAGLAGLQPAPAIAWLELLVCGVWVLYRYLRAIRPEMARVTLNSLDASSLIFDVWAAYREVTDTAGWLLVLWGTPRHGRQSGQAGEAPPAADNG